MLLTAGASSSAGQAQTEQVRRHDACALVPFPFVFSIYRKHVTKVVTRFLRPSNTAAHRVPQDTPSPVASSTHELPSPYQFPKASVSSGPSRAFSERPSLTFGERGDHVGKTRRLNRHRHGRRKHQPFSSPPGRYTPLHYMRVPR